MALRLFLLGAMVAVVRLAAPADPQGVAVHWAEGTLHGFLELHAADGTLIATGDLLQVPRDSDLESRLVFHFTDGSLFRETVTFTQHGVFRLKDYRLEQRGNAFASDLDASLAATVGHDVPPGPAKEGKEERYSGTLDLDASLAAT